MMLVLGAVFVTSLLGSLHCVGMCGPFAMLAGCESGKRSLTPTLAYSGGRLLTYSLIGVLAGMVGSAVNELGSWVSIQQTTTFVAGALMIMIGVVALLRRLGMRLVFVGQKGISSALSKVVGRHYRKAKELSPVRRGLTIGALSSLMPCGWLYTFAVVAAGTGHPLKGLLVMVVFWSGTLPIMLTLVFSVHRFSLAAREMFTLAMGPLVILIGIFTITFRAPIVIAQETPMSDSATDVQQIQSLDPSQSCCH